MKIVLIGAGSAQFGLGTLGDIMQSRVFAGSEIALVDIDSKALDRVFKTAKEFVAAKGLPFALSASTDRKAVLPGADFVLVSIEIGNRFELWDQDWGIPLQYGIRQVYGENGGPGGLFHALRITPVIVEICDDVVRLCPDAFVFSYSNPMTAITTTVLRKHPGLKFIGLCHEIGSLNRYLPAILGTPFENLRCRAAGLNHFSVLLEARYVDTGKDAYADILAKAPAFFEKEIGYSDVWEYAEPAGKSAKDRRGNGAVCDRPRPEFPSVVRQNALQGDTHAVLPPAYHRGQPSRRVHLLGIRRRRSQGHSGFLRSLPDDAS